MNWHPFALIVGLGMISLIAWAVWPKRRSEYETRVLKDIEEREINRTR